MHTTEVESVMLTIVDMVVIRMIMVIVVKNFLSEFSSIRPSSVLVCGSVDEHAAEKLDGGDHPNLWLTRLITAPSTQYDESN